MVSIVGLSSDRGQRQPSDLDAAVRDNIIHFFDQGYHQTYANRMIATVARRGPRFARAGPSDLPHR
eukprot:8253021-Pyramimonas_sp.AAC.2